jgi:hypothetical protein
VEVLDRRDQLPLRIHTDRILQRFVDDQERHKRGKFEILEADADLGGTMANGTKAVRRPAQSCESITAVLLRLNLLDGGTIEEVGAQVKLYVISSEYC